MRAAKIAKLDLKRNVHAATPSCPADLLDSPSLKVRCRTDDQLIRLCNDAHTALDYLGFHSLHDRADWTLSVTI